MTPETARIAISLTHTSISKIFSETEEHPPLLFIVKDNLKESGIIDLGPWASDKRLLSAMIRAQQRAKDVCLTIFVSEAWMITRDGPVPTGDLPAPSEEADREEVVFYLLESPELQLGAYAPIIRDGDKPATLGALKFPDNTENGEYEGRLAGGFKH